jgi:hypothetical protein
VTSTRAKNDATNKIREAVLKIIDNPPKEYFENKEIFKDKTIGELWQILHEKWNDTLKKYEENTNVPNYTSRQIKTKGGRTFNYDLEITYHNEEQMIATRKIEFKYGCSNISALPQFLSLQTKYRLFDETYAKFWYENYLDKYLECDVEITEPKPSLESYLKYVTNTNYSMISFFTQLKNREDFFKTKKNLIVKQSITDYLTQYGNTINLSEFSKKVKETQMDKIYLLWYNEKFHIDQISETDMSEMSVQTIKNGNVLQIKSGNTIYNLLLRWRNHKGILNPAWQISMKRLS